MKKTLMVISDERLFVIPINSRYKVVLGEKIPVFVSDRSGQFPEVFDEDIGDVGDHGRAYPFSWVY